MNTPPVSCATCGKILNRPSATGRKPRYCLHTGACRQKAYRRRVKERQQQKRQQGRLVHLQQESFEWYTPIQYIQAVKRVFGDIELDPASSEQANRIVKARVFYDLTTDSLIKT